MLIVVLWVTAGLVGLALYFAHSMVLDARAAENRVATLQAEQAIEGAIRYIKAVLANGLYMPGTMPELEAYAYEQVQVGPAWFWILGRDTNQWQTGPTVPVFGLIDEASKLNLNVATADMLLMLPNMTSDLAGSILTWRGGAAGTTLIGGADDTTYGQLDPPYQCKKAPFETVEELRMVYGMTMDILYGEDLNCNGILDPNEDDGAVWLPVDNRDGKLDPGLWEYLTVFTREPNTGRTNVNDPSALSLLLQEAFGEGRAREIMTRLGIQPGTVPEQGRPGPGQQQGQQPVTLGFTSPIDFYLRSGLSFDEFAQIADMITVTNSAYLEGLVNVNTASEVVLACIPGIGVQYASALVAYRRAHPEKLNCVAWVIDVLGQENARVAGPFITVYTYQYSADIVAVGRLGRGYKRVRVVIDTSDGTPRVVFRQDLTHLGWALGRDIRERLMQMRSNMAGS